MPLSKARDYLSIGEVLDALRPDFPEVSISKIRFLEAEGLIEPERTAKGYRKFYEDDLARLRQVLTLQRDQFLPLRVIKERLQQDHRGAVSEESGGNETHAPTSPPKTPEPTLGWSDVELSRQELAQASGLSESDIAELEQFGVLDAKRSHDGNDLAVAEAARRLYEFGFEPRHLRMYRQASEREASLIAQVVRPLSKRKDPKGQEEAEGSRRELLALSRQLREALLRSSLRANV